MFDVGDDSFAIVFDSFFAACDALLGYCHENGTVEDVLKNGGGGIVVL